MRWKWKINEVDKLYEKEKKNWEKKWKNEKGKKKKKIYLGI